MKVRQYSAALVFMQISVVLFVLAPLAQADESEVLMEGARVFDSIASVGCKTCHGEYAEGDVGVGPYIRGATEGTIRAAIDATNEMIVVKNVITEEQIQAVAAYVGQLGTMQPVRTLAKRGRFLPAELSVRPGTAVQLIIQNSSIEPHAFKSDNMGIDELVIAGRSSGSLAWQVPESEGEFSLYCTDCKLKDQFFTVHVDSSAAEFRRAPAATTTASDGAM
jgi:mono/diheme cytochrome c family protein